MGLAASLDENFIDLARSLRDMLETTPKEFHRFVMKSGLGKRKCYYLVNIDKAFRKTGVARERLRHLGWTKAKVLTPYITKENAQQLLVMAETHTALDLERILKAGKKDVPRKKAVVFHCDDKEFNILQKALLRNGAKEAPRGLVRKEEALLKIVRKALSQT